MVQDADTCARHVSSAWRPVPHHIAYRHTRESVTALLEAHPDAQDLPVPACPGWTVGDLLSHLVENCRFAETNTTVSKVVPDRPLCLESPGLRLLLDEWSRSARAVEEAVALLPGPQAGSLLLMDAFTHEYDARVALGAPLPYDHPAFPGALDVALTGFAGMVLWQGLPTMRIETEDGAWTVGKGELAATLRGGRIDVYRSLVGRRSLDQIAALDWTADSRPWHSAFTWGPFRPPPEPVEH